MLARTGSRAAAVALLCAACLSGGAAQGVGVVPYNLGGSDWATISPANAVCKSGQAQSPVNIVTARAVYDGTLQPVNASYAQPKSSTVRVDGEGVKLIWDNGAMQDGLTLPNGAFLPLSRLVIRSPSEHTVNGQQMPMEINLVHTNPGTLQTAIISVLFHTSPNEADNGFLAKWLPFAPTNSTPTVASRRTVPNTQFMDVLVDLLGSDTNPGRMLSSYYTYNGSATAPPCKEGVQWFVMRKTQAVSTAQVMNVTNMMAALQGGRSRGANARLTQPLNGRVILTSWTKLAGNAAPGAPGTLSSQFGNMLTGGQGADKRTAHVLAEAVAALAVVSMMFCCLCMAASGYVFVLRQEVFHLKRGTSPDGIPPPKAGPLAKKDALATEMTAQGSSAV